jgi:GT2 family glycosyltransferase
VAPISIPNIISLSAARNMLLREAERSGDLKAAEVIAYPDDDCWYPAETLRTIAGRFRASGDLDFLFCRYASTPALAGTEAGAIISARARHVVRNASSNTIFIRGDVVRAIGCFDEMLGVGTPNNGGEDVEYALRAYLQARRTEFVDAEIVGHRDRDSSLRAKYYRGALLAIRRHALQDTGVAWEYVRKVAIGLVLMLRGEVRLGEFISSNLAVSGRSQ